MYRTRITARLLVGVAVTAVSGCMSVAPPADVPPPESGRPVHGAAPRIAQPPVRDSLGALPDPTPSASAPSSGAAASTGRDESRSPQREHSDTTRQRTPGQVPRIPPDILANMPDQSITGKDVCSLGRAYGQWPADSPESRICDEAYGRR